MAKMRRSLLARPEVAALLSGGAAITQSHERERERQRAFAEREATKNLDQMRRTSEMSQEQQINRERLKSSLPGETNVGKVSAVYEAGVATDDPTLRGAALTQRATLESMVPPQPPLPDVGTYEEDDPSRSNTVVEYLRKVFDSHLDTDPKEAIKMAESHNIPEWADEAKERQKELNAEKKTMEKDAAYQKWTQVYGAKATATDPRNRYEAWIAAKDAGLLDYPDYLKSDYRISLSATERRELQDARIGTDTTLGTYTPTPAPEATGNTRMDVQPDSSVAPGVPRSIIPGQITPAPGPGAPSTDPVPGVPPVTVPPDSASLNEAASQGPAAIAEGIRSGRIKSRAQIEGQPPVAPATPLAPTAPLLPSGRAFDPITAREEFKAALPAPTSDMSDDEIDTLIRILMKRGTLTAEAFKREKEQMQQSVRDPRIGIATQPR